MIPTKMTRDRMKSALYRVFCRQGVMIPSEMEEYEAIKVLIESKRTVTRDFVKRWAERCVTEYFNDQTETPNYSIEKIHIKMLAELGYEIEDKTIEEEKKE